MNIVQKVGLQQEMGAILCFETGAAVSVSVCYVVTKRATKSTIEMFKFDTGTGSMARMLEEPKVASHALEGGAS